MSKTITFNGTDYTEASVAEMSVDDLLTLRNLVASNLGVAAVKSFKTKEQGASATWKALDKWDSQDEETAPTTKGKAKAPAEPKEPRVVKGALPAKVKRPTKNMFRKIQKVSEPDRVKDRWDNYKDGMTILETIEGDNMTPLDIYFYAEQGNVKLIDPTEEEVQAGMDAWYKREGIENPAEAKRKREEERAKAKAEREAKKEADKKAKEEAKAAKAKEREEAKAAKEAEKKAKADAKAAEAAKADAS